MSVSRSSSAVTQEEIDAALARFLSRGGAIKRLQDPRTADSLSNEFEDPFIIEDDSAFDPDHVRVALSDY